MVVFNICGVKLPKIAQQLKLFFGVYNQAQMPNKHIQVYSRFSRFNSGRGRPHPLYTNRSYPTFSPTLVQLNIALYSALRRPMSLKLKILCGFVIADHKLLCSLLYSIYMGELPSTPQVLRIAWYHYLSSLKHRHGIS